VHLADKGRSQRSENAQGGNFLERRKGEEKNGPGDGISEISIIGISDGGGGGKSGGKPR